MKYKHRANVTESERYDTLLLSFQVPEQILDKNIWLLDSGCRNHMTDHNDFISNIDTYATTTISLGDDHLVKASEKGVVPVLTKHGEVKNIYDVYYVPNLKHNLLSVGQLMTHGYDINFHDTYYKIFNPNTEFVAKIYMTKNRLFPFEMRSGNMYACNLSNENETELLHYCYGYLPVKSMSLLQK